MNQAQALNATVPQFGAAQLEQLREVAPRALAVAGVSSKGSTYYNTAEQQRALVDQCITE